MKELIINVAMGETVAYKGYFIYVFEHAVSVMETEDYTSEIAEFKTIGGAIDYIDELKHAEARRKYYENKYR